MPQNFFITGMPKSGKTTLLQRLVKELKRSGMKVGGFLSPEESHHGTRTAFYVEDIATGKRAVMASVDGDGPKVSKYHVRVAAFESVALPAMAAKSRFDVMVIDEIGRMELKSRKFSDEIDRVFEHPVPLIAALQRDLVDQYAVHGEVFTLTESNREETLMELLGKATKAYQARPAAKPSAKPKKNEAKPITRAAGKSPKRLVRASGGKAAKKGRKRRAAGPAPKNKSREAGRTVVAEHKPPARSGPEPELGKGEPHKKRRSVVHRVRDLLGF